ncbi:Dyp-type peroxidase [Aestuariibacter salexigens]|uniref:Dyp-type peroxidase n=1 Tax=Aestuariibacter salexigens TaxID=226010 RepID=UPI0003FE61FF|nr:Dyp-type peroxidase [Aestuariibacter salexigens]
MGQAQKGVCAEPNLHAQYLLYNVVEDDAEVIRAKLVRLLDIFDHFDNEHYEAMVSGMVAVGSHYWSELYPGTRPVELAPFPDMQSEDRCAPVTPVDLFIQIRADRLDICHAIGAEVHELLKMHVELVEQVRGFRYLDGRDLTGFVNGTANARGMRKLEVALVGDDDPEFSGGSYVHVQRYRHDMTRWQYLDQKRQEHIIGRTKQENLALPHGDLPAFSHSRRTRMKDPEGKPLELLRQGMPYGDITVQGLFFVSCANSPSVFRKMLESMIYGDEHGDYDKLLDFTSAETGAAFFAPATDFIKQRATS